MAETSEQIKTIVGAALELPRSERASYVDAACTGRTALRAQVESLLRSHDSAPASMDRPAPEFLAPKPDFLGRALGPYRITARIGEGGIGTVFRGERVDDHGRTEVAIRILKPQSDPRLVAARFDSERQVLARLNHPGIARLFDGGTTEEGFPYFVMEWIEGRPIDQYCRDRRIGLAAKLELFQQLCAAVDYAHRNLIVHRNLKPGNILITPDGRPKVLDFGVATILPTTTDTDGLTQSWSGPMTPEYASPEQLRGEPITTATDVYSLGVILHELLYHRRPYRGSPDIQRAIGTRGRTRPSAAEEALRGDLDAIVLTAMRNAPERRYASPAMLSLDIQRYLAGQPIAAQPDKRSYRAGKFVRRHKLFCATAILLALSTAGGIAETVHAASVARLERARAEKRFDDVRTAATSVLFDLDITIQKLPGARPARTFVVAKALEFLDNLAQDARGDLSLLRDLAAAYERVADLQSAVGGTNLGDAAGAAVSLRKAIGIRETVARAFPDSVADGISLASVYGAYAGHCLRDDSVQQQEYNRRALDIRERLYAKHPHDVETLRALGRGYWERSNPLCATSDYQSCLEWRMRALHLYDEAAYADPSARNRHSVGMMHMQVAAPLQKLRDYSHALDHSREAVAIDEALAAAEPHNAGARRDLSVSYQSAAKSLLGLGWPEEALEYARKSLEIREELAASVPADADLQAAVARASALVADSHLKLGHKSDAARYFRQAIHLFERLPNEQREIHTLRLQLGQAQ